MAKRSIDILIRARDQASRRFGRIGRATDSLRDKFGGLKGMLIGGLGFYALSRGMKSSVTEFAAMKNRLAEVSTMLSDAGERYMPAFERGIRGLRLEFGATGAALSKGLYDILSASVSAADAMGVLTKATKAARAGVTDTAVAVDGITSLLNAYQLQAAEATRVSDLMFSTVKRGKITFEELAGNIGKVAPMARAAGMGMEDMLAAVATLTRQGLSAEQATTRLVAILKQAPAAASNLLKLLSKFKGKTLAEIMRVVPETRAASGIAALAGDLEGLGRDMAGMRAAAGATEEAFAKMAGSPAMVLARFREEMALFREDLGQGLMPVVTELLGELRASLPSIKELIGNMLQAGAAAVKWGVANKELALTIGAVVLLGPKLIGMIKATAAALAWLAANPIGLAIAGAVALGLVIAKLTGAFDQHDRKVDKGSDALVTYAERLLKVKREALGLKGALGLPGDVKAFEKEQTIFLKTLAEAGGKVAKSIETGPARAASEKVFIGFAKQLQKRLLAAGKMQWEIGNVGPGEALDMDQMYRLAGEAKAVYELRRRRARGEEVPEELRKAAAGQTPAMLEHEAERILGPRVTGGMSGAVLTDYANALEAARDRLEALAVADKRTLGQNRELIKTFEALTKISPELRKMVADWRGESWAERVFGAGVSPEFRQTMKEARAAIGPQGMAADVAKLRDGMKKVPGAVKGLFSDMLAAAKAYGKKNAKVHRELADARIAAMDGGRKKELLRLELDRKRAIVAAKKRGEDLVIVDETFRVKRAAINRKWSDAELIKEFQALGDLQGPPKEAAPAGRAGAFEARFLRRAPGADYAAKTEKHTRKIADNGARSVKLQEEANTMLGDMSGNWLPTVSVVEP